MIAAAAYAARGMELPFSMGLRPRLSADAAFAAYSNPRLAPGDYSINPVPLGKVFVFGILQRFFGSLQGTDCAGRAWACLRSNTRDDCCRRLRGSGDGTALFHGLTPTAKCGRRIRGLLEPRAGARGLFYESCPPWESVCLWHLSLLQNSESGMRWGQNAPAK